jgi:hypothetical protein
MNEELIDKMFQDAVSKGYSEDKNSFISLLNSDDEVFYDMYSRFAQGQMNKDQFRSVITPKKKEPSQVGSQKTPPTSGSKPAQSSGKSFAGSIDYLEPKPKFGEIPTAPKVPGTERVVPAQQATKKPETTKRTIVRGEEADQAIAESLKPQQVVSESTKPVVTPPAPMTVEEGELQKVIEKEKGKQPEFIDFQDIEKLYSDPENETSKYYEMFLQNAKNSQKGDIEYGKRLRDAYAADFIDAEFENEYRISSDIDNLTQKMKSELASLSEKAKTDPNAANLFESKKNEYFALISKKQNELDAAREQTNQGYKNRIAEIDKLFQTGEAALREEGLLDEKKELQRRMGIIELAKNPGSLKDNIGQVQYNKLPGATAQDKLINYLNSRLTAYDRFYNANKDADSLPQEMRNKVKDSYSKLQGELKDLYYLTSLKRFVNPEDRPGFWEATGEKFAKEFLAGGLDFTDNAQMHSENLQTIAKNAGISFSDKDKSYIETTAAPADAYSPEWWGDNFGSTLGFGANIAVSAPIGNTSLKIGEGIVKATPMFKKIAEYGLKRYSKLGSTGQKITNTIFNSLDEGYNFEMANQLIYDGESDELTFLTGVGGAIAAAPVNKLLSKTGKLIFGKADDVTEAVAGKAYTKEEAAVLEVLGAQRDDVRMALQGLTKENGVDDYVYMLQGTFGNKAPEAIKQIQKVGSVLIARPTGEVTQEMGEELTSIYRQSDSFEAFKKEFSKRFPDADAMTQFVVASYVMGLGFGAGNYVGDVFTAQSKKSFDQLPPDQQEIAAEAIREATEDINKADTETINEIELDEVSRPKTKEEEEWSAKEGEIKQGIDSNTKRINELDGLKNQIYSNYNITDPKTEDISNISEEDARRLEILNSEIDKADKARIKDEIELELHNNNKPAVEQAPVNAIHAKDLKKEENAVQEPSTEEVLPRQQGATTETGGEPQGMGQDVQGEKVTQEGQEVSQEGVTTLNQESFSEDVTPEQKAKVEEQNQKDEDESINEIYDFNDEIKSVGTKEQFKQFLRSLSPIAAFSRIAWHNTKKPELTPREGQYYTNTRKNAEDTYKQDNTFAAIVFGNAPKKASFDEVQQVDTKAVKGEGADIVITDDLSPAIGADMNYREFVPTSADQVIPIGTKENIEAFKAFVEQQKAPEVTKPSTEQKVEPEISLSGLVNGFTGNTYNAFDPRGKSNVMEFVRDGKSFAEVVDKDGKKYVVVGLALEGDKRAYGAGRGRDRFSFASAELNESTPDNIVDILENSARDNFKSLYEDFNYEEEVIKPITEINTALPTSQTAQATEEVATEEKQPTPQEQVEGNVEEVTPELEKEAEANYESSQESRPEVQDAIEFAKDQEATVNKVIDNEVSDKEQEEIAKELGISKSKVKQRIADEVAKVLSGSKEFVENTKSKFKNAVSKVVKYIRKGLIALAIAASTGVSFGGIELMSTGYANNSIEFAISILPTNVQETAVRGMVKLGLYDVNKNEQLVNNSELQDAPSVSVNPEDVKYKADNTFTQVVGKVKDSHARATKGSELIMIRNQFFNENGFNYIPGSIKSRSKSSDVYNNALGVAHFMILDDQGVDLTNKTTDQELSVQSDLFKKQRVGRDISLNDYVPVFKKNSDGSVNVSYKKASDLKQGDITITKLNQYKLSDIDFNSKADGRNFGFKSGTVFGLKTKGGKDVPSLLFTSAGKDAYSRFSGGSAVFIFKDKKGNLIVRDFSGSINMIQKEGSSISEKYGVPANEITIGFYDAGSYTGKPAAKNGVVSYSQYSGYNTLHPNSGGALIIPNSGNQVLKEGKAVGGQESQGIKEEDVSELMNEYKDITDAIDTLLVAEDSSASAVISAEKEVAEKLGEEGEKLVEINRNFDKLAEDLGFIKTCII